MKTSPQSLFTASSPEKAGLKTKSGPQTNSRKVDSFATGVDQEEDVVVGSHSHCRQPLDSYHGRPIIYSLSLRKILS
jgi:hypothetical protein